MFHKFATGIEFFNGQIKPGATNGEHATAFVSSVNASDIAADNLQDEPPVLLSLTLRGKGSPKSKIIGMDLDGARKLIAALQEAVAAAEQPDPSDIAAAADAGCPVL